MVKFFALLLLFSASSAYSNTWYFNAIQFDINAPGKGVGEINHKKINPKGFEFIYLGVKCKFTALEKNSTERDLKCNLGDHEVKVRASCHGNGMAFLDFKPKGKFNQRIVVLCEN